MQLQSLKKWRLSLMAAEKIYRPESKKFFINRRMKMEIIIIENWQTLGLLSCYVVGTFFVIWKIIKGEIL